MGIATNVLGILKLATGAARIGRGGSTVADDLTALENGQSTLNDTLTAEAGKVVALQHQVVPLARAVRVIMSSSASRGARVSENEALDFGTSDITFFWLGRVDPTAPTQFIRKRTDSQDSLGFACLIDGSLAFSGAIDNQVIVSSGDSKSTETVSSTATDFALYMCTIERPLGGADAVATYYENGSQLGDSVSFPDSETAWDFTGDIFISGTNDDGDESEFIFAGIYNRVLSPSEALQFAISGPSLADIGKPGNRASNVNIVGNSDFESWFSSANLQVWTEGSNVSASVSQVTGGDQYSGTYSVQFDGAGVPSVTVNNVIMQDKFSVSDLGRRVRFIIAARRVSGSGDLHVGQGSDQYSTISTAGSGLNSDWKLFVVEKTLTNLDNAQRRQVQFSGDSGSTFQVGLFETQFLGITGLWSAEHAQSDTGQIIDQIHGNHALLPPAGATIHPQPEGLRQVKATLTWNGDSTAKYLLSNQDILPDGFDIERVKAVVSGTPVDGTLGDSIDADRYCTLAKNTGLVEGSNTLALSQRTGNGNNDLLWKPSAAFTGTIKFYIYYFVGEQ